MMPEWGEKARLDTLRRLDLLDTPPSEAFDRITRMAAEIFKLPIAAVSLTDSDRQWFKSRVGVDHWSIPRDKAPCAQVAESLNPVVIPDLLADPCYRDSLLGRSGIRFYAGAPLVTHDGYGLGAMCVLGPEPRQLREGELALLKDLAAMVMSQIELQHAMGRIDPVSGLPNRTQFTEDLDDLAHDHPGQRRLVVLVDLANPEQISNTMRAVGPSYLDEMIKEAAWVIRLCIGAARKAYHIGPTQFAFLALPEAEEREYLPLLASMLAEIRRQATSRFVATTSVGVAAFILGKTSPGDVLRMAHSAAQHGRASETRVSLYSPAQDTVHHRRFTLLNEFGAALEARDQLSLVYQPRIDLISGICTGAEALLRWKHPSLGNVSPGEFMPIVEQTILAKPATAFVLGAALRQLAAWRGAGLFHLQLSVNISAANLLEPDFADQVAQALARHSLPPGNLELEVTESVFLEDAEQALATLTAINAAGVGLAIDDFGTGYSSFSYLQRLPASVVKIDQSFIRDIACDARKKSLVSAIASLAHDLGSRVVAEGVETREVLDIVNGTACEEAQGYLFGRPMPPEQFMDWTRDWTERRSAPRPRVKAKPQSRRKSFHHLPDAASSPG